ncbi:trypsin-like serine protease [Aquabacter sp. CN5-332]|uniref:trypsin-like serine protease n=1 Tax=Aquabacter sp. CN5-332 TaxID=3156608 RepID=UPI0032B36B72
MRRGAVVVLLLGLLSGQAGAVVVLDSTWKAEGGGAGHEAAGFSAHIRLAHKPQFRALMAMSESRGKAVWGVGSATWIGNDADHGYVLTAAHVFTGSPKDVRGYIYRADDGTIYRAASITTPPGWNSDLEARTGYDFAIVQLTRPVTGIGPAPALYAGRLEAGKVLTFMGYGERGIGSVGQHERFYEGSDKAAAQGLIEEVVPLRHPMPKSGDAGGYLGIFLPKEDGSVAGPYKGPRKPVSRLAGLLGSGDSGGSAWVEIGGIWAIAGINSSGSGGDATGYGNQAWFARVSDQQDWIKAQAPMARWVGDTASASAPACTLGVAVSVLWEGDWYPAHVRGPMARGLCPIRYDDFDSEWDEAVGPDRMRQPR